MPGKKPPGDRRSFTDKVREGLRTLGGKGIIPDIPEYSAAHAAPFWVPERWPKENPPWKHRNPGEVIDNPKEFPMVGDFKIGTGEVHETRLKLGFGVIAGLPQELQRFEAQLRARHINPAQLNAVLEWANKLKKHGVDIYRLPDNTRAFDRAQISELRRAFKDQNERLRFERILLLVQFGLLEPLNEVTRAKPR